MAGLTTSFSLKPVPCWKTTLCPLPFSSSDSKLFGFRVRNPNLTDFNSLVSLSSALATTPITSRYGGGGGSRYSGPDSRRSRESDSEGEQALDLSTIRSDSVRLIDEQQNMVGIVSKAEARRMAEDVELDLVILSPDADPPVVRIMDYKYMFFSSICKCYPCSAWLYLGQRSITWQLHISFFKKGSKYRYEQQKKKREQQKKSAASRMDLKELKMRYNIDQHDYSVRLKSAQKFLKDGDKVKVIVNLKGRENEFRNIAIELIKRFQNEIGELATEESKNFRDRNIFIILVPNKAVIQKAREPPKKKDKSEAVNEVSASI